MPGSSRGVMGTISAPSAISNLMGVAAILAVLCCRAPGRGSVMRRPLPRAGLRSVRLLWTLFCAISWRRAALRRRRAHLCSSRFYFASLPSQPDPARSLCAFLGVPGTARRRIRRLVLVLLFFSSMSITFSELLVSGIFGSLCATASTRPEFVLPTSTTELQPSATVTNFVRHGPKTSFSHGRVAAGLERRARAPQPNQCGHALET